MPLILATRNAHKLDEVGRILAPYGLTVEGLPAEVELPPEDAWTYEENALGKARAAALALGQDVIADDSGIESEALGGKPGVRSARFAGPEATDAENLALLIASAPPDSALQYVCALAFVSGTQQERVFSAVSRGRLWPQPRGERGFGYDPAFIPEGPAGAAPNGDVRTLAELTEAEKDAISHRGQAVRAFAEWYAGLEGPGVQAVTVEPGS